MYKISYATGSRADYGIVRNYLDLLEEDKNIELNILVTGTHLEIEYGKTVDIIEKDGHKIDFEVFLNLSNGPLVTTSIAVVIDQFGKYFEMNKPDLLVILGDRYEMLGVAIAAAIHKIKILHLHGGEATFGNYDEFIRHAITKMSLYHIVATEQYRKRVVQLGENPKRVYNLGALGAENCRNIAIENVRNDVRELEEEKYFVILFHPETLTDISIKNQIEILLGAISCFSEQKFIFLGSNADTGASQIRNIIKKYVRDNEGAIYFENLNPDSYHFLLKNAICLIGNSSSGIIEAPSLGAYTINIGDRQKGREFGNSIINVKCNKEEIVRGINKIINGEVSKYIINPYETNDTARQYYETTIKILQKSKASVAKIFWDI